MPKSDESPRVTRIARRRARPGHEADYEAGVRAMLAVMRHSPGFLGGELLPPDEPGGLYQVSSTFATEQDLATWDASRAREAAHARLSPHAVDEPEYRRLTGLEAWFEGPVVPASMRPPRHRMALVTWLGIWPTVSVVNAALGPTLTGVGLPYLAVTALTTALVTFLMAYVIMPQLTRLLQRFLTVQREARPAQLSLMP